MSDREFSGAAVLRLNLPVDCGHHCTKCGEPVSPDTMVGHAMTCHKGPQYVTRHNLLALLTVKQSRRAGVHCEYEEPFDRRAHERLSDVKKRPDGIQWFEGRTTATDTTVCHPTAKSNVAIAAKRTGAAVAKVCKRKHAYYDDVAFANGVTFYPLACESYGLMHKEYREFLAQLAVASEETALLHRTRHFKCKTITRLIREVGVQLQRGNAIAIHRGRVNTRL